MKTYIFETNKIGLPAFISYDSTSKNYKVAPTIKDTVGKYQITIKLADEFGAENHY